MKIGDEVYVHGYVDEIRQGVVIIRNNGGYFGTVAEEVLLTGIDHIADRKTEPQKDCFLCKWLGDVDVCGRCRNRNLFAEADTEPKPKTDPQTSGTPYEIETSSVCKTKPQTVSLTSAHISGDIYHKVKTEL